MTDEEPYGPPSAALPLEQAMRELLPAKMWEELARAENALENATLPEQPSRVNKTRSEWRAAKAKYASIIRAMPRSPRPQEVWEKMHDTLHAMLEAGELEAFGQEDPPFGPWKAIPARAWRKLRVSDSGTGTAKVGANVVHDIHILPPGAEDHMPTGMPGRPTLGREIILAEFLRRSECGETASNLTAESRALEQWYASTYPKRQCPTLKTISGYLRDTWRSLGHPNAKCRKY